MSHSSSFIVEYFTDLGEMAGYGARLLATAARESVQERGSFILALSGGSSPKPLFERLADLAPGEFPWKSTHVFWADERLVGQGSPDSNQRLAREHLLDRVDIPAANIHAVPGLAYGPAPGLTPEEARPAGQASAAYEADIRRVFEELGRDWSPFPSFDLIHLGLGPDGHTASLFPGDPALGEARRIVVPVGPGVGFPPVPRLSMTLKLINAARCVLFFVSGQDKRAVIERIMDGEQSQSLPAGLVRPAGEVAWLVHEELIHQGLQGHPDRH